MGLSKIWEISVFGGLPLDDCRDELRCGVGIVDLSRSQAVGGFWFNSGVEEVFTVTILPGYHNPDLISSNTNLDDAQSVWLVPSLSNSHFDQALADCGDLVIVINEIVQKTYN